MDWTEIIQTLFFPIDAAHQGFALYALLLIIGFLIGGLTGFFGIGGGFLIVPLLNILAGIPYQLAVGSSLTVILGTSFSGMFRQHTAGNIQTHTVPFLAGGAAVGAVLGDLIQNALFSASGFHEQRFSLIMHGLYILLLVSILFSFRRKNSPTGKDNQASEFSGADHADSKTENSASIRQRNIPLLLSIGLFLGILTGLLGVGGGVLLIPILIGYLGVSHKKAAAASLAVICSASIAAIITKGITAQPEINLLITVILLTTSIMGLNLGISFLEKSRETNFRSLFSYILIATIVLIIADILHIYFG